LLFPLTRPGPFFSSAPSCREGSDGDLSSVEKHPLAKTGHLIAAYELSLRALGIVERNDPLTIMIAKKVLEIAATGLNDPAEISKRAVKSLTFN
jgi:hypothetical protein